MLEQLFLKAPTAMLLIDPINNKIIAANQLAEKLFSLTVQELTYFQVTYFFPDCIDKLHLFSQQVLTQGNAWTDNLSIHINNK